MKCPHCDYIYGHDFETNKDVKGNEGNFYVLKNLKLDRLSLDFLDPRYSDTRTILGCPRCTKVFMS